MAKGGIDLGGTKIEAVVTDDDNGVLGQARQSTPTEGGPADIVAAMAGAIGEAADAASLRLDELAGVGVGSPGSVDSTAGTVANARNLPNWEAPFPLTETLTRQLGVPVHVGNDVGVAVEAE